MTKAAWTPWHEVVRLRDDLRTGELPLASFAADLYDVGMGRGRRIYQEPTEFFSLTYPTFNLRELAKDVVQRLAGRNEKAIRQLELTYGGGKTHTLITLYHLVQDPENLPDLPSVREFIEHCGVRPPRARVAVLPFDKLDVEKGMEVRAPDGQTRWLKQPWSVLAFQIDGPEGLALLHPDGKPDERGSAPAENLLESLLARPRSSGLATLVLVDEVLMYAREKVGLDPAWRSRLVNFFQYLTQAAVKVDGCAVVASLLATDPGRADSLGKEIIRDLYDVFRREREESVQPVLKEDVAEVLRRRFFTPESVRDREKFRAPVVAALKGIADLDETTRKDGKRAEERFLASYPFHPELTEVFYTKWTNLEGFQRTRGILRTFALALRDAEGWDGGPLVAANVFLAAPDKEGLSEAARELASVAASEEYEGKRQEWTAILLGEIEKAREIQSTDVPSLGQRELEQAVIATFLHSQPIGQRALTRDLLVLLGASRPDRIDLEKGLLRWADVSWFLDEGAIQDRQGEGAQALPKAWRLGSKPNLRQMHHDACTRVSADLVEADLVDLIAKEKSLTAGASAAGARVHNLPVQPRNVDDDGEFRFAVLGPKAASESGKPSSEAVRYLTETTGPDRPRAHPNALVLACASRDGLEVARRRIREWRGWLDVKDQLSGQEIDPVRGATLAMNLKEAERKIGESIRQAYCIVVTVSEKGEPHAFKLSVDESIPLFQQIKNDPRSRIQETAITPETLLPGGPYQLWNEDEPSRWVKDLVGAFAQQPRLPKMLNRQAILTTLVEGCREGRFVLRLTRPDRSVRTWWLEEPDEAALREVALEAVLPEKAQLSQLASPLLAEGRLPGLWKTPVIRVGDVYEYFGGGRVVQVARDGWDEPMSIPAVPHEVVDAAVRAAVQDAAVWFRVGPASLIGEEIPTGLLTEQAQLAPPPPPVPVAEILPETLPAAWAGGQSSALAMLTALAQKSGAIPPWSVVRAAIQGAISAGFLALAPDSVAWPCDVAEAARAKLVLADERPARVPEPEPARGLFAQGDFEANEVQDLAERIPDLMRVSAGSNLRVHVRIELDESARSEPAKVDELNRLLAEIKPELKLR